MRTRNILWKTGRQFLPASGRKLEAASVGEDLVRSRRDVDAVRAGVTLELVRQRHVIAEEAVARHLKTDDARQDASGVKADSD